MNSSTPVPPQTPPEEWTPADDAIIGRAFKWSLLCLLAAAGLAAAIIWWNQRARPSRPQALATPVTPLPRMAPAVEPPRVVFTEVTRAAGIQFTHYNGAAGEKLLPETMGGGVAFTDLDADGLPDLLFVNCMPWPWDLERAPRPLPTHALYRNHGQGQFTDITAGSGLDVPHYGMGVAVGDYDNDGLPDVFITGVYTNRLYRNLGGGKFRDVTAAALLPVGTDQWGVSAAFFDYDNDGWLDLWVCHYVQWSREIDAGIAYSLDGRNRAYGQPWNFAGAFNTLYRNLGNGQFEDVSARAGIQIRNPATGVPAGKSLGVAPVDLDGDGWMDVVVANDTVQNFVFHNQRNGAFREIGAQSGIAFDSYGNARGAMGIDAARFREDTALGIAIANFANEMNALYVTANRPLLFTDEAIVEGLGPPSRAFLKFGLFFFDYDLDGRLDLLTANGHLENEISKIQRSQSYQQPAQLFWNAGPRAGGCFIEAGPAFSGPDLFRPIVGRGSAYADMDGDGDLDVVLTQIHGPPLLLRNDQNLGHDWFRLQLVGRPANRDGLGAWVEAQWDGLTAWRHVMTTRGYLSCSERAVTFGAGRRGPPQKIRIHWPGGAIQELGPVPLRQTTVVVQNTSGN
jgi:hypothetical protein